MNKLSGKITSVGRLPGKLSEKKEITGTLAGLHLIVEQTAVIYGKLSPKR